MDHEFNYLVPLKFSEGWTDGNKKWIQLYPYDSWDHPFYGTTTITPDIARKFVDNFNSKVRGQEIHSDYEHGEDAAKGSKASGKLLQVEVRDDGPYALVEFTEEAKKEIDAGEWNYWSTSHYDTWTHPQTKETHNFVLDGGGLTNKPYVKNMIPLNFSELMLADPKLRDSALQNIPAGKENYVKTTLQGLLNAPDHVDPVIPEPVISDVPTTSEDGMDELLKKFSELFGLGEDATEEAVIKYATDMQTDIGPLRELQKSTEQKKSFSERFPEEAQELEEGRIYRREQEVKKFTESLLTKRVTKKVNGDGDEVIETPTGLGLSALAIDSAGELVKKFNENTATADDFRAFTETVFDNGIVDYGTHGSSREDDLADDEDKTKFSKNDTPQEIRKKFSEQIQKLAKDEFEGNITKAYAEAQDRWPDEFNVYRNRKPVAN